MATISQFLKWQEDTKIFEKVPRLKPHFEQVHEGRVQFCIAHLGPVDLSFQISYFSIPIRVTGRFTGNPL